MSTELERGDVFFFYRPRVGIEEVRSLQEVQRFFFVLHPDGDARLREIIVGSKRLPEVEPHERAWAFVARVTDSAAYAREELGGRIYQTKTRGERVQPDTRAAGEGRYAIVDHDGHSHLAYALELPQEPGEAQRTFRIEREASYIVAVRNPDAPTPPRMSPPARAPSCRSGCGSDSVLGGSRRSIHRSGSITRASSSWSSAPPARQLASSGSSSTPRTSGSTTRTYSRHYG